MPYSSKKDLPKSVQSLPDGAKKIFMAAFNAFMDDNPDASDEQAFKVAWSAVKRKYKKDENDKWVVKDHATVEIEESLFLDAADLKITQDGYLVAQPKVARTGIQDYRGWEVGRPNVPTIRLYRPEEEVFDANSLKSIAFKPITIEHPKVLIDSKNWKKFAKGTTGNEIVRDGEFVRVPMMVMDSEAIEDIKSGKRQISLGYTAELIDEAGKTEDGRDYDMVQTNIRINHLAVVTAARGGSKLILGDAEPDEELPMANMKTILVDGISLEVPDTAAAVIQRNEERQQAEVKRLSDAASVAQTQIGELTAKLSDAHKASEETKGKVVALEAQLKDAQITPAKLDEMVKVRSTIVDKAKAIVGDALVVDGKTEMEIKRQAVEKSIGDAAIVATLSDEAVNGAFVALKTPEAGSRQLADHLSGGAKPSGMPGVFTPNVFGVSGAPKTQFSDSRQTAWENRGKTMREAWRDAGAALPNPRTPGAA